jgi:very-short-patch-repair endonuclease
MRRKLTQKEVLDRFKKVHGDSYDYSLVEYVKAKTKIKIICNKGGHGIFEQRVDAHYAGNGCPECAKNNRTLEQKEVIERFKKVHGDTYDYSLVEYEGQGNKVIIVCPVHGDFPQKPGNHVNGDGCPDCGYIKRGNSSRKTTEKFIEDAKLVHGDTYDYSLVAYVKGNSKVLITCKKDRHGVFSQKPNNHLQGSGCPDCGEKIRSEKRKLNQKEVLERLKKVHGDEYDYSLVEYVEAHTKISIRCRKDGHGIFEQTLNNHLRGQGCPKCGIIKSDTKRTKSTVDFIKQAKEVHPDKNYGYDKVDYKVAIKEVIIVCPVHGEFSQIPNSHLQGIGCRKCGTNSTIEKLKLTIDEFIERSNIIHNNFYGYEKVVYVNNRTDVIISCPVHGEFSQTPGSHLQGQGCEDCGIIKRADAQRKTLEQFIQEANLVHKGIYKYDNVDYKTTNKKVSIICKIHGDFPQTPSEHLLGSGCPKCYNKREGRLAIILNEIGVVHRNYRINNRFFDFYLPEYDLIIERDGEQHYFEPFMIVGSRMKTIEQNHQNDIEKTELAKSKGHKICRIPYWLREEDEKKEIQNILNGQPTYPDVPDLEQAKTKPLPN